MFVDEGAWGRSKRRGKFIRIVYAILIAQDFILLCGALIGSVVDIARDYGNEHFWEMFAISLAFLAAGMGPIIVLMCSINLRYYTPSSFIFILFAIVFLAGTCACTAAITYKWLVPGLIVCWQFWKLCIIIMSFMMDVGRYCIFIISFAISSCVFLSFIAFLYLLDLASLYSLIVATLIKLCLCVSNFIGTTSVLREALELELDSNDYLLGTVMIACVGTHCTHCC